MALTLVIHAAPSHRARVEVSIKRAIQFPLGSMLTKSQIESFVERGYIKIPGAVPRVIVDAARKAINHSIGAVGQGSDDLENFKTGAYCDELKNQAVMTDLYNRTPVMSIAEQLIGEGKVQPVRHVQMARRFPTVMNGEREDPRGHLDGLGNGKNGQAKGMYRRGFMAFAVIYLADVPEPYSGNFTVWPKTHRFFEDYFKENGTDVLKEGTPKVPLPDPPIQICGEASDAVIAHHQIVHTGGPNASPDIRYAAITRLRHVDCDEVGQDAYTDIRREWEGVGEAEEEAVLSA